MFTRSNVSVALALTLVAGGAFAQSCPTVDKVGNFISPGPLDAFGAAMALSFGGPNNLPLLAVGRPGEDAPGLTDAGGFAIYQRGGSWGALYEAWNATGQAGEKMGSAIALADPYLIVGAPAYNTDDGRAFILRRSSGSSSFLQSTTVEVLPANGPNGARFGSAVAISDFGGGWAVVGAPTHSFGLVESGSAYFYVRNPANNQWTENFHVWGGDYAGDATDRRGSSVAMSQTSGFAAVGIPFAEDVGQPNDHGKVMIFERLANGNVSGAPSTVRPPSPELGERFGSSVAIEGDTLVVGAPGEDLTFNESGFVQQATDGGAIYVFARNGSNWDFVTKLRAPSVTPAGLFGTQVATDGGLQIVVSEPGTKGAFVFSKVGGAWKYQATFTDPDSAATGQFASTVAVRNGLIAVGDAGDDTPSIIDAGAVYAMTLSSSQAMGDLCSDPMPLPTQTVTGCTTLATASAGQPTTCGNGNGSVAQGPDVWYAFTPSCDGNAIFDTFGSDYDTVLSVHSSCPGLFNPDTTIACSDDHTFPAPNNRASLVTFNFTGGQTYLIRVAGYNGAKGDYTLRQLISYGVQNDTCSTATPVGAGTYQFNNCSATDGTVAGGCRTMYKDVWYRYTAAASGAVTVDTCGTAYDTVLQVFIGTQQSCPTAGSQAIACNDDGGCGPAGNRQSKVAFNAVAGQSYLIRAGGYSPIDNGPGLVTIDTTPGCDSIDFNGNEVFPEDQDVIDFFNVLSGGECSTGTCSDIDFNNNQVFPEDQDVVDFFTVLAGGEC